MSSKVSFVLLLAVVGALIPDAIGQASYCNANPNPCLSGGTCQSLGSSYRCLCLSSCSGSHCETCSESSSSPCSPNPCKRDCMCLESCQHAGGYYCRSASGYLGKNCSIPVPTLKCEASRMVFSVSESFVKEYDLGLKNSFINISPSLQSNVKCEVSMANSGFYEIQIPLPFTACGTEITESSGSVAFTNQMWFNRRLTNSMFDMPIPVAELQCKYERQYKVVTSVRPALATPLAISDRNVIIPSISLCKVPSCPSACPENFAVNGGAVYTVGEIIHVSLTLDSGDSVTGVEDMFLSCSQSSARNNAVEIVREGCSASSGLPSEVRSSAISNVVCVSFQAPRSLSCPEFYIHAKLQSCDPRDARVCFGSTASRCSSSRRKRSVEPASVVVGPILIVNGSAGLPSVQIHGMEGKFFTLDSPLIASSILRAAPSKSYSDSVPVSIVSISIVAAAVFLVSLFVLLVFVIRSRRSSECK